MIENKKYEITFTKDTEVTFYDKNYRDRGQVFKVGEKIVATFLEQSESNPEFKQFKAGKEMFSIPQSCFDSIRVTK